MRAIVLALLLAVCFPPTQARADLAFAFAFTSAFAASDPFPNQIDSVVHDGPTGFLEITNLGPGDYSGIIRIVAISAYDGDLTFTIGDGFIPAGGSVSIGMPVDSSAAGGFNSFTGSFAPSVAGTFRPGIIAYMEGGVAAGGDSGSIKIAAQDLDMRTDEILTDPNNVETNNFVLQGGDPFGLYNGDAWEVLLPYGHLTLSGVAIPEPGAPIGLVFALAMLALIRVRRDAAWRRGPAG